MKSILPYVMLYWHILKKYFSMPYLVVELAFRVKWCDRRQRVFRFKSRLIHYLALFGKLPWLFRVLQHFPYLITNSVLSDLALKMRGIIEQAVYSSWVWVGDLYKFESKNSLLQSPILISVTKHSFELHTSSLFIIIRYR